MNTAKLSKIQSTSKIGQRSTPLTTDKDPLHSQPTTTRTTDGLNKEPPPPLPPGLLQDAQGPSCLRRTANASSQSRSGCCSPVAVTPVAVHPVAVTATTLRRHRIVSHDTQLTTTSHRMEPPRESTAQGRHSLEKPDSARLDSTRLDSTRLDSTEEDVNSR